MFSSVWRAARTELDCALLLAEYVEELRRCGPSYSLWAALEEDLAEPLRGVASCVERCCLETEEHIQHLSQVLVPAIHEYVLCADTVKVSTDWSGEDWQSSSSMSPSVTSHCD